MSKTVVVTGAFGQVGKRCTEILLERGYRVVALDLRTDRTEGVAAALASAADVGEKLQPVFIDLLEQRAVTELIAEKEPEAIIHFAAICSPPCYLNRDFARRVNVDATRFLVEAACELPNKPLFVFASSSAVYGSRNPYRYPGGITLDTPASPIDCYGEDKVASEYLIMGSGLPYAIHRLGGVVSPDGLGNLRGEYLLLMRATPGNNRVHAVDARDAAIAFANAVELSTEHRNMVFLIGGNDSYKKLQREIEDDMMEAMGIGRLGRLASLPGNPDDDLGWSFTDWYDTAQTEAILHFQKHHWDDTAEWMASVLDKKTTAIARLLGPLIRGVMLSVLVVQRRLEKRGRYADPWTLIVRKFGKSILADPHRVSNS